MKLQLTILQEHVENLDFAPLQISSLSPRVLRDQLREANKIFSTLIEKIVGREKAEQATFLLQHLKRLYREKTHLSFVMKDLEALPDYGTLTKDERKRYHRRLYRNFDELLQKMSGSSEEETHRSFLSARFAAMHQSKVNFKPLVEQASWRNINLMIKKLAPTEPTP